MNIVWDVGNVLIQWNPHRVYEDDFDGEDEIDAFLEEIGFAAWNIEQDRGRSWADGVAQACARHPGHTALIEKFDTNWHDAVPDAIHGSVAILEVMRRQGTPLYAITNFSTEKWGECRERFPFLATHFRDVVVSAHERVIKPDAAIFTRFLQRNRLQARDCLFIDDSAANIATARTLGFETIRFESAGALKRALLARGIRV